MTDQTKHEDGACRGDDRGFAASNATARRRLAASVRKADSLARQGHFDEAALRMEQAVQSDPGNAEYLLRLAGVRRGQGRTEEAIDLTSRALDIRGRDSEAQEFLLQLYLETGQYEEVISRGKHFIRSAPNSVQARDLMGAAYLQLGLLDKALQMTSELIHMDPTDAVNHFKRAVLYQQKGELGKAIREFIRVIELDPEGEMADEAKDAILTMDAFQLRQIIALAIEDRVFRARLMRDPEAAATDKGFYLSSSGIVTLKQVDFEGLAEPPGFGDQPTYH